MNKCKHQWVLVDKFYNREIQDSSPISFKFVCPNCDGIKLIKNMNIEEKNE